VRGHERRKGTGGTGEAALSGDDDVRGDPPDGGGDDSRHRPEVERVERVVPDPHGPPSAPAESPREHALRPGRADRENDDAVREPERPLEGGAVRPGRHDEPVASTVAHGATIGSGPPEVEVDRDVEPLVDEDQRDHESFGRAPPPVPAG
jgi:hypothetical protein